MIDREFVDVKLFHVAEFQLEFANGELADYECADGDGAEGDSSESSGTNGYRTGGYADFDNGSCAWVWEESHAGIVARCIVAGSQGSL